MGDDVLDDILNGLVDRFGGPPSSLINLINEARLRLLSARFGVSSVVLRGCGVVCSIRERESKPYSSAVMDYADYFFKKEKVVFHFLPLYESGLSLCVHFTKTQDSYLLFSRFFYKFDALEKYN